MGKAKNKRPNININVTVEGDRPKVRFFPFWLRWVIIWLGVLLLLPLVNRCH